MGKKFKDLGNVVKNKHIEATLDHTYKEQNAQVTHDVHNVQEVPDVYEPIANTVNSTQDIQQNNNNANESFTHKEQDVQDVRDVHLADKSTPLILGTTQGVKGKKLPRINMAFSSDTYEYIKRESRIRGLSATAFVNYIIEEYKKEPGNITYLTELKY